jgi:hypothetical protein
MKYMKKAEPYIKAALGGGDILPVEGSDDAVCRLLDLTCGIDYFHVCMDGLTWGVASRIQSNCDKGWNTFTIRTSRDSNMKTEFEKRKQAIEKGGEYPFLTMQGYFDRRDRLISLAIARTIDVIECVEKGIGYENHTKADKTGQSFFWCVPWDLMEAEGYKVRTIAGSDLDSPAGEPFHKTSVQVAVCRY